MKAVANTAVVIVYLFLFCSRAFAQSAEEKSFLSMYFKEEDLVVQTATRSPQPLSTVAENMTVVTAADIELMNAHTLADVLNTVNGVEIWMTGGPGQIAQTTILGSESRHVTVIMDGVVMNFVGTNLADLGWIPVQDIEKIEIIKGPASSAWGSALGGVVNIITKSGRSVDQGGVVYGSYGNKHFGDFRAEVRGKLDKLGYYLTAGRLQADGLSPYQDVSENTGYMKLSYDFTAKTNLLFAFDYAGTARNDGLFTDFDFSYKDISKHVHSALALNSAITKDLDLDLSVRAIKQYVNQENLTLSTGGVQEIKDNDKGYGSSAKLTFRSISQTVVVGADSESRTEKSVLIDDGEQSIRKWAMYANDTIVLDRLAVTPGVRFDHTNTNGSITSPSLGITYTILNNTIFRAFAAKGFNIPTPGDRFGNGDTIVGNPELKVETVKSYQAGVESAALKYVWLKFMVFRNDIQNGLSLISLGTAATSPSQVQNVTRQRREGVTIEARTAPVFNTSLSVGAEFISSKDLETGDHMKDIPVQVYDVALRYDDQNAFKALLQGRHINWNAADWEMSKYHSMLLDLTLIKKIYQHRDASLEAFANGHNLLNTPQYNIYVYPNPARWYEAGLKYKF